ncbi:hypothetical protein [Brachybacterium sacelli]
MITGSHVDRALPISDLDAPTGSIDVPHHRNGSVERLHRTPCRLLHHL